MNKSNKPIKTDADVMRIAERIQRLSWEIQDLISQIDDSEHPNAHKIAEDLMDECSFFAWPTHVCMNGFVKPDEWDYERDDDGGYGKPYHKRARAAHGMRRINKLKAITPHQ